MTRYRTGNHWGVTIVREGTQPPAASGTRADDHLVAVVLHGDAALAERICALLNGEASPSLTHEEWRVTGDPGDSFPPYEFTFSPRRGYADPEHSARGFIALVNNTVGWRDGPHLHRRTVTVTEWTQEDA